jgi:hypothetical protein
MDVFISECLKDIKGTIVDQCFGVTSTGQKYLIVINKKVWYAIRILLDIGYANNEPWQIYREGFFKYENAKGFLSHCVELAKNDKGDFYKLISYLIPANRLSDLTSIGQRKLCKLLLHNSRVDPLVKRYPAFFRSINAEAFSFFLNFEDYQLPDDVKNNPGSHLTPGDYVMILRKKPVPYNHHAIYIGKDKDGYDKVIHIFNDEKENTQSIKKEKNSIKHLLEVKREAYVREDKWERFYRDLNTKCYKRCFLFKHKTNEDIVKTAQEQMAENTRKGEYTLLKKNCRHFATFCATNFNLPDEFTSRVFFNF